MKMKFSKIMLPMYKLTRIVMLCMSIWLCHGLASAAPISVDLLMGANIFIDKMYFEDYVGATYGGANVLGRIQANYHFRKFDLSPFVSFDYGLPVGADLNSVGSPTLTTMQLTFIAGISRGFNFGYSAIDVGLGLGVNWKEVQLNHPIIGTFDVHGTKMVPLTSVALTMPFYKKIGFKVIYSLIYLGSQIDRGTKQSIDYRLEQCRFVHKVAIGCSIMRNLKVEKL